MAKWKSGYKTLSSIGLFAGTDFQPGTVQPQWNWVHSDRSGMERRWALEATYGDPYIGGVPASGIEIDYNDLYTILNANDQELFALRFGTEASSEILVVYARRGNESGWWPAGGCTIFHVTLSMYARVYSDPNTYTQRLVGYADCDVFKPLSGNITASHSHLEFFRYNNTWMVGLSNFAFGGGNLYSSYFLWNPVESDFIATFGQNEPETTRPKSDEYGPASEPGGGYVPGGGAIPGDGSVTKEPTFDNSSDKIEISTKPTLSAISAKFLHAYVVTEQSLEYIGDALFPQPVFQQPDLITAMGELAQIIFFNKQVDYMLDLLILPIDVPHGNWEPLNVGGRQLSTVIGGTSVFINGQPADDCYVDVTCGSISIDEYWVNFLDFAGTKVKLFLPYIGYVDIQPEYVIGGTLYVDYRFNILDGSFMAYVRSDSGYSELEESLVCQYAGVAAVHVPLQSKDYSAKISGLISAIGTVGAGAISGGIGAAAAAGATANAANTIVQKPGTSHANGYNASSSFLSHRKPYLIIERQWSQFSQKYPEEVGMPSNVMCRLGDLHGLVISANAHLDVIPCSVEGKERISALLADGIIL